MKRLRLTLSLIAAMIMLSACVTTGPSNQKSTYSMVDVETAKVLHDRGALFVDVRNKTSYDEGHIAGAVNLDSRQFTNTNLAKAASKDQELVFYCYGIHCDYSNKASSRALSWGYQKVYYFMKGYPAWWDAGYPIEQSPS